MGVFVARNCSCNGGMDPHCSPYVFILERRQASLQPLSPYLIKHPKPCNLQSVAVCKFFVHFPNRKAWEQQEPYSCLTGRLAQKSCSKWQLPAKNTTNKMKQTRTRRVCGIVAQDPYCKRARNAYVPRAVGVSVTVNSSGWTCLDLCLEAPFCDLSFSAQGFQATDSHVYGTKVGQPQITLPISPTLYLLKEDRKLLEPPKP